MTFKEMVLMVVGAIVLVIAAGLVYAKRTGPHPLGPSSIIELAKHSASASVGAFFYRPSRRVCRE